VRQERVVGAGGMKACDDDDNDDVIAVVVLGGDEMSCEVFHCEYDDIKANALLLLARALLLLAATTKLSAIVTFVWVLLFMGRCALTEREADTNGSLMLSSLSLISKGWRLCGAPPL
jgi:hypothetical protein